MNKIRTFWEDTAKVWLHEMRDMFKDEGALLFVILLPLSYPLLYSWIYNNEVVREVPVAIVDNSHSQTSREFVRHVDASSDVRVAAICNNLEEASRLVGQQEVYGIILLPEDFDRRLGRMEQAHVSVYCNMGLMLTYKAIFQTCTAVAADMNAHIQIALSGNYTNRDDQITASPINVADVPIFNNTGGYGNFILPGVLVLIIQQVMLLGIGITYGTSYEKRRFGRLTDMYERRFGLARIMVGRQWDSLCYSCSLPLGCCLPCHDCSTSYNCCTPTILLCLYCLICWLAFSSLLRSHSLYVNARMLCCLWYSRLYPSSLCRVCRGLRAIYLRCGSGSHASSRQHTAYRDLSSSTPSVECLAT